MPSGSGVPPHAHRSAVMLGLPAAFVAGALIAGQAKVNAVLAQRVGGGFPGALEAALISFLGGIVILAIAFAAWPSFRRRTATVVAAARSRTLLPWQLAGGLSGAFLVSSQGLAVRVIGVALFIVGLVTGQTVGALVVDHHGVGPGGLRPVTATRVVGVGIAVAAVCLSVSGRLAGSGALPARSWVLLALPLVAGIGASWQQAVNGRVATVGGAPVAALVNFVTGTAALIVLFAITAAVTGEGGPPPAAAADAWLYLGGPIGLLFIWLGALLVRPLGVLVLGLATVAGQVAGGLVLDLVAGHHLGWRLWVGSLLTVVGVALAARRSRPGVRPAAPLRQPTPHA